MDDLVDLYETPQADEVYMIAGWRQWADAGSISSGLPEYLIDYNKARKIGEIKSDGFYLFQLPGTHHFLRPEIALKEGYRQSLSVRRNEIFYHQDQDKGLVIFLGDEPHMNAERYADAFFDVAEALRVKRVVAVGGVYGAMPYEKEREVSCTYSMPHIKAELEEYAVKFSNYEGGTTIGTYLVGRAEERQMEFIVMYAFVPAYDFPQLSTQVQGLRIENDYKAWYEMMRRFNYMLNLGMDLTDLQQQSDALIESMEAKISELEERAPQLKVREFMQTISEEFTERPFMPLSDVWETELGDLLDDIDEV